MDSAWHSLSTEETLTELCVERSTGLTGEEVASRLLKYGENRLTQAPGRTFWSMLATQLKEFLVLLLLTAAVVSALLGELADAAVIIVIVALNAVIGVVQESKAEKSIEALKRMAAPTTRVLRDGKEQRIDVSQVVPGDILMIEAGDKVPADARLLASFSLKVDESILTGESVVADKRADVSLDAETPLGDRANMLYSSTKAVAGRGVAVAVSTGMLTEVGKIAGLIEEAGGVTTPLQRRLEELGKKLGAVAIGVCVLIFIAGMLRGEDAFEMLMTSVSLAVAAIPEGLPAIVTVVLALGVQRMSRHNAVIRRLPAVETLGSATFICSDKTGTLTQNKMVVRRVVTSDSDLSVSGEGYITEGAFTHHGEGVSAETDTSFRMLLEAGVLCNDAQLVDENGQPTVLGDPTEGCLLVLGAKAGVYRQDLLRSHPRLGEIPFDSNRKRMTTIHPYGDGIRAYVKGAFDSIIDRSRRHLSKGSVVELEDDARLRFEQISRTLAGQGMRVLAIACRDFDRRLCPPLDHEIVEADLTLLGLVGIIDPPRREAAEAVKQCRSAGITPVMITGDHKATAMAIAEQIGIAADPGQAISGSELDSVPDDALLELVRSYRVYARVSPHHKMRIVKSLQQLGEVVAMTGDGVNDAPALKKADIGAAMGITGTEVAKEASDMVLADDNFATIVYAVREGRVIFDNIRKSVYYLLSCNAGELVTILAAILVGWQRPLVAIQILWVNLVTDGLPALALGVEPGAKDIMSRPPRRIGEGVFTRESTAMVVSYGLVIGMLSLASYYVGWRLVSPESIERGRTFAFGTLAFTQLMHAFNVRCHPLSALACSPLTNGYLLVGVGLSFALQVAVMAVPWLRQVFRVTVLDATGWIAVLGLSLAVIPVVDIVGRLVRLTSHRSL